MRNVLVLNASYEPLSIVSFRRATCLVLDDKAEIIEHDGGVLRSPSLTVPVPSVVRLRYMVRVARRRQAVLSRRAVFARDDHTCQYCGGPADSIDHVLPRSRGGGHDWENLVAACRRCNLAKRDRTPEEAGMRLRRPGCPPRPGSWVVVGASRMPDAWKPYLARAS
ncbi:MAG: HNH endonuclease [Ilumatobacteraceae bacterium]|jgi:5-methylcytosine-specific restriction endonuclease McrA|nr:HNH endonuclease [Ilumatobacteraceae bacterium]MBL6761008.1 HNH endonuclease [Ilumatobacteraceae bacterium]MDA0202350.1 HNH endonuclease [Actinomycetota bacterium]MDA2973493.1 HNH endonuclease [Actinomycetota bacterium]MDA3009259.1 HNH endonuclease [Actinomycetota bacterium]